MNEDKKLANLEETWKNKFERYTAPAPTSEQTNLLIQQIKAIDEQKPLDLRAKLEERQNDQSVFSKIMDMFVSQWNFHSPISWFLAGSLMILLTTIINLNMSDEITNGFITWIKWITFIIIGFISFSFRNLNEGNQIIEKLSYYPLIQQMFIRFVMIMGLQLAITLPLSLFIVGKVNTFLYLLSSFTPILFFGVFGFVSIMWLGQKGGSIITIFVWFGQALFDKQLKFISLFQTPGNDNFMLIHLVFLGIAILLLSSMLLKHYLVSNK